MDASPTADLATLVVRWHNRHPLARRITPAEVQGEGLVLLPYRATRWARGGLRRAFDEALVAPLGAAEIAHFGRRAGSRERPGPPAWPQRQATVKAGVDPAGVTWRYLRTAAIELGQERRRVLIGSGPDGPVIGARLYNPRRLRVAVGALGGLVIAVMLSLGAALGLWPGAATDPAGPGVAGTAAAATRASGVLQDAVAAGPVPATSPVRAALAAAAASAARPATGTAAAAAGASATARPGALAVAHAPAPAASSPLGPASAAAGTGAPARGILPTLTAEARRQARSESQALRAAQAASAAAADPAAALASAQAGQVYAVATPSNRTRAGAQLRIVLMNAPTSAEAGRPRAEVLQVGDGWRAVIWPYADRASAERTRELLSARGIPAEVIAF